MTLRPLSRHVAAVDVTAVTRQTTDDDIAALVQSTGCLDLTPYPNLTTIDDGVTFEHPALRSVILPPSLTTIGDGCFFKVDQVDFSMCARLSAIGAWFRASGVTAALRIDLSKCAALETIGDGFLARSRLQDWKADDKPTSVQHPSLSVRSLHLPPSIETIGDGFCYRLSTLAETVDLSGCGKLKHFGHRCFVSCRFKELRLPPSLETIGDRFCVTVSALEQMDLTVCPRLSRIGERCLFDASVRSIAFPPSVTSISRRFAVKTKALQSIDLRHCGQLLHIPDDFLKASAVTAVVLPTALQSIGASFCSEALTLTELDMSHCTALKAIGEAFLGSTAVSSLRLPPSIEVIGPGFCTEVATLRTVDLRQCTNLREPPRGCSNIEALLLPQAVEPALAGDNDASSPFHTEMMTIPKTVTQDHIDAVLVDGCLDLTKYPKLEAIDDDVTLRSYSMRSVVFPASLRSIGNAVTITGVHSIDFSRCRRLERIGVWFRASGVTRAPLAVDLSKCAALIAIGSGFLAKSYVDNWKDAVRPRTSDSAALHVKSISLPASIETVGDGFCYLLSTLAEAVDLSGCGKLKQFGHRCFVSCRFKELRLPPSLETIGDRFCVTVKELDTLDLSKCPRLTAIGERCLFGAAVTAVTFPPSIESLGKRFATTSTGLKSVDLSDCPRLTQIEDDFLLESEVETVWLPPNVTSIGGSFCAKVTGKLTLPDLADCSRLATIGEAFVKESALPSIELPGAVTDIGQKFAASTTTDTVGLAKCATLSDLPAGFLEQAAVRALSLPRSLATIGDRFCAESKGLLLVDLSFCASLQTIAHGFLLGSDVQDLLIPTSITRIGDGFCAALQLSSMDLGACGQLTRIGDRFLGKAKTSRLCFPPALVQIGRECCHGAVLQECETVVLPAPVQIIGDGCFQQTSGVRIVEQAAGPVTGTCIGGQFCAGAGDLESVSLAVAQVGASFCADTKSMTTVSLSFIQGAALPSAPLQPQPTLDSAALTEILESEQFAIGSNFLAHAGSSEHGGLQVRLKAVGGSDAGFTIGEGFLSGASATSVDLRSLRVTSIGKDFGRRSMLSDVRFPHHLREVDIELCTDCAVTDLRLPLGVLRQYLKRITAQSMSNFTRQAKALWDRLGRVDRHEFLLFFFERGDVYRLCEAVDLRQHSRSLQKIGGGVRSLRTPTALCAALLTVQPVDSALTLLHWASMVSRDNPALLKEKIQWRLDDLKATTTQGFTPLHYGVMYGVDGSTLQLLLKTASAAEVRATWREASRRSEGSAFSPLHLAILYHRSELVSVFLEASWNPTERSMPKTDGGEAVSAYDLAVLELGLSRRAARATTKQEKKASKIKARASERATPTCVQLALYALQCVKYLPALTSPSDSESLEEQPWAERLYDTAQETLLAAFGRLSDDAVDEAGAAAAHSAATLDAAMALRNLVTTSALMPAGRGNGPRNSNGNGGAYQLQPTFTDAGTLLEDAISACLDVTLRGPHTQEFFQIVSVRAKSVESFCDFAFNHRLVSIHAATPAAARLELDRDLKAIDHVIRKASAVQTDARPPADPESFLSLVTAMESGPAKDDVVEVLQSVIPYSEVWPVLPFFFMTLLCVFGVSWFYNPPILRSVLTDFEHNVTSCIDSFPDRNTLPYSCSATWVSVTGLQSSPGSALSVSQYTRLGRSFLSENNVTMVPWETMRFEGRHLYRGVVDGVTGDRSSDEYEYWVMSELRRAPYVTKEYVSGDIGKTPTWNARHTGTRDFTHVVVPVGFGEHALVVCWIVGLCVLWIGCVAALVFDATGLFKNRFNGEDEKLLVMPTALSHALRFMGFAGQCAGVLFSGAAIVLFTTLFWRHHEDRQITWEVMGVWVKTEALFRLTIFFSSFRAVCFFRELPKPHHFARGNLVAMLALLGLLAYALATKSVARFRSFSQLFAADSLLSLQTVDAFTLPLIMGVSVFFRAKVISDVVRQQHYYNLRSTFGPTIVAVPPAVVSTGDGTAMTAVDGANVTPLVHNTPLRSTARTPSVFAQSHTSESLRTLGDSDATEAWTFKAGAGMARELSPDGSAVVVIDDGITEHHDVATSNEPFSEAPHPRPPRRQSLWKTLTPALLSQSMRTDLSIDDETETEVTPANNTKAEGSCVEVFTSRVTAYVRTKSWQWWATVCVAFVGQMLLYTVAVLVLFRAILFVPAPGLVVEFGPGNGGNDAAADNTKWFKTAASMWT